MYGFIAKTYVVVIFDNEPLESCRKRQDYVYVKGEYHSALQKINHYLRRKNKLNKNKVLSYCDRLSYM